MADEYIEPPRISSTLQWKDVELPPPLTVDDFDEVILSKMRPNRLETARIIGDVVGAFQLRSIRVDDKVVGARIHALAEAGRIESAGNVFKWRHGEVRLEATAP